MSVLVELMLTDEICTARELKVFLISRDGESTSEALLCVIILDPRREYLIVPSLA